MFCGLRLGSRRHKSKKHANATAVAGGELDNDTTIVATAASQNGTDMKENHNPNVIRTGTRDTFISAYGDQTKQPLPDDCGEELFWDEKDLNKDGLLSPMRTLKLSPISSCPSDVTSADDSCSIYSSRPPKNFHGKGQIRLSVYVNYGLLTVHVMQGKHLMSKWKEQCDSFVKLCLVPDGARRTLCQTECQPGSNIPVYDEKFSFELLAEDMRKRLMISIWHRDAKRGACEFLGCMSFGIETIYRQNKTINGWYYLLSEELGRWKHLQAAVKKRPARLANNNVYGGNGSENNRDVVWMEPHVFKLRRNEFGFGFSLIGNSPVRICRVDRDSPAEHAGLRKDDCIVAIDGMNVSRSTAESIAKILKQSSRVVMEIQRSYTEDPIYARVSEPTLHEPESTINNLDMPAPLGGSTPYDCRGERRLKGESSGYHSDSEIRENDYGMMTHYQWTMSRRGSCAVRESRYGALTLPRKPHSSGSSARHYHNEYRQNPLGRRHDPSSEEYL